MAFPNNRLSPSVIQADRAVFTAIQGMGDYAPANTAYVTTALTVSFNEMEATNLAEFNAQNALNAARDAANAAEHRFHNNMLGTKAQVVAQYGNDSDQVQAIGLKKKSERKPPVRRPTTPSAT